MPQLRIVAERIQFQDCGVYSFWKFLAEDWQEGNKSSRYPISYRVRMRTLHIGGWREVPEKSLVEPWQDPDSYFQGFLRPSLDPMMEIVLVSYSCCKTYHQIGVSKEQIMHILILQD